MVMFTLIAIAIDISEKTDDFVKTGLSAQQILTKYYFGFVPFIWGLLYPLFVFIAVIFFTSRMAGRSEIIAILASGTSFNRTLRPYLIGGILLGTILWLGNRYVLPKANDIKGSFHSKYLDKNDPTKNRQYSNCYNCFYLRADSNTYIGIKSWDPIAQSGTSFFLHRVKNNKLVYNLRSSSVKWDTATKKWKISQVIERKIDSLKETVTEHPDLILKINLKPDELRNDDYIKDKLTTPELARYIRTQRMRGSEGLSAMEVERHRRTATPFSVLLLTFIGAVIASKKTRGGSGLHLAIGIIIASVFIIADRFSTVFATKGNFDPLLAAWLPNIAFIIVAIFLYRRAPK